jgi:protein TonB
LLGITFHFAKLKPSLPTLDVTLVNVANQEAPDKADFLAQANNSGGGQNDRAARPSDLFSGALPQPTQAPRRLRSKQRHRNPPMPRRPGW